MSNLRERIRTTFNAFGLDVRRFKNAPERTWLGIRSRPIRTIVDVGANSGQFARLARSLFPAAEIHCFEPLQKPFSDLQLLAQQDGRIRPYRLALGDKAGSAVILAHMDHSPSSSLLRGTAELRSLFPQTSRTHETEVVVSTLDEQFPDETTLAPELLLKLDVQGYEDRVLRGGRNLLKRVDILIAEVSVSQLYEGQASFFSIYDAALAGGLRYAGNIEQFYGESGEVIYLDALFVRDVKAQ